VVCNSTPAAPQTIVAVTTEWQASLSFWMRANNFPGKLYRTLTAQNLPAPKSQEKQKDRDARISRVRIYPGDVTIDLGERVRFSAVAFDQENNPVGGVDVKWSGQSSVQGRRVRLTPQGEFEGTAPGSFTITAEVARSTTAQITVVVRPGVIRNMNLTPTGTREVSTRDNPESKTGSTKQLKKSQASAQVSPKARDRRSGSMRWYCARSPEPLAISFLGHERFWRHGQPHPFRGIGKLQLPNEEWHF